MYAHGLGMPQRAWAMGAYASSTQSKVIICYIPNVPLLANQLLVLSHRTLMFIVVGRPRNGVGVLIPQVCVLEPCVVVRRVCCIRSWNTTYILVSIQHPLALKSAESLRMLLCIFFPDSCLFYFHRMRMSCLSYPVE